VFAEKNACVPLSFTAEGCERRRRRFFLEGPPWGLAGGTLRCPLQRRGGHGRRGDLFRLGSVKNERNLHNHRTRRKNTFYPINHFITHTSVS
jgi:hypothetical protein